MSAKSLSHDARSVGSLVCASAWCRLKDLGVSVFGVQLSHERFVLKASLFSGYGCRVAWSGLDGATPRGASAA